MRYKKSILKEEGFLLLESLLTMTILIAVMTILCPLIISWVSKHRETKNLVEESRQLYESSFILNQEQTKQYNDTVNGVQIDQYPLQIRVAGTEVVIYEAVFKK